MLSLAFFFFFSSIHFSSSSPSLNCVGSSPVVCISSSSPKHISWFSNTSQFSSIGETLKVFAWHASSVRIVASPLNVDLPPVSNVPVVAALSSNWPPPSDSEDAATGFDGEGGAFIISGNLKARVAANGTLSFHEVSSGKLLLVEFSDRFGHSLSSRRYRRLNSLGSCAQCFEASTRFVTQPGEQFFGLGSHMHGRLNQRSLKIDMQQMNTRVTQPLLLSSRGYSLLWNTASDGDIALLDNYFQWTARSARRLDYVVSAPTAAASGARDSNDNNPFPSLLKQTSLLVGPAPLLDESLLGPWQCRNRYRNQTELLDVARGYQKRGLPLSVVVIDFFNWAASGDWALNPACWPEPKKMMSELKEMGVRVMVSVWPNASPQSHNWAPLQMNGYLLQSNIGRPLDTSFGNYDPFNAEAREFVFDQIKSGYIDTDGIDGLLWLDADEPQENQAIYDDSHLAYAAGSALEVGLAYPREHARTMHDGLTALGLANRSVLLSRSAWAGSQALGVMTWTGDIPSTFESMQAQLPALLNSGLSSQLWITMDTGGFFAMMDNWDPRFQNLLARWYQFSSMTTVLRVHGQRSPPLPDNQCGFSGGYTAPWHFPLAYDSIATTLKLREALVEPYIKSVVADAAKLGLPPVRPCFVEFTDPECLQSRAVQEEQFMFGSELLVAPVFQPNSTTRAVYLPSSAQEWTLFYNLSMTVSGGHWFQCQFDAWLDFPLFFRAENQVLKKVAANFQSKNEITCTQIKN